MAVSKSSTVSPVSPVSLIGGTVERIDGAVVLVGGTVVLPDGTVVQVGGQHGYVEQRKQGALKNAKAAKALVSKLRRSKKQVN